MPVITLPDGSSKTYDQPVPARKIAEDISRSLAKKSVGVRMDGQLRDLETVVDRDCKVLFVLEKPENGRRNPDALFLLRHTSAHVMAEAIQQLYPKAELVYGPPTEDGFFYDIRFPDDESISSKDFEEIEKRMSAIAAADKPITRYEMPEQEALAKLQSEGNKYKLDNAVRALEGSGGSAVPGAAPRQKPPLSFYATGTPGRDWEDLCSGPHLPSTGWIKAFKVMSLASSYWHGDESSDRLTRVYGTAFYDKAELEEYLKRLEEA
ncbi:MAG: TGS domain-containing protein, partial [Terriglobia bacterium]